jgi:hypothetical protein
MLKWLIRRRLAGFEREYSYSMDYARDILDADLGALLKFMKVMGVSAYRKDVPIEPWYAAKIAGTLTEDCGPCTQLVVTMAEREGVATATLRAILAGDVDAMTDDVALAYRFSKAVLAHEIEADSIRAQVEDRWGKRGLVSLAFPITMARFFPTLKFALGRGRACVRVTVAGTPVAVRQSQDASS